jgi:hypothetical protein
VYSALSRETFLLTQVAIRYYHQYFVNPTPDPFHGSRGSCILKRLSIAGNINSKSLSCALGALFLLCSHASAAMILTLEQAGSDVVVTASGSIDLTGLTYIASLSGGQSLLVPNGGVIAIQGANDDQYSGITGPGSFGAGGTAFASSQSGDNFSLGSYSDSIEVPFGYVSDAPLSATATWDSTTLSAMGVTPGTYTWTWGTGADADSLTLYAGVNPPAAAPEPGSLLLLSAGFAAFGGFALRKRMTLSKDL